MFDMPFINDGKYKIMTKSNSDKNSQQLSVQLFTVCLLHYDWLVFTEYNQNILITLESVDTMGK